MNKPNDLTCDYAWSKDQTGCPKRATHIMEDNMKYCDEHYKIIKTIKRRKP